MKEEIRKAVIPVAGLGTRGLPFTKVVPKELLPIIDTPTIVFIVEEIISAGLNQVILVTSHDKVLLEQLFSPSPELEELLVKTGKEALAEKIRKLSGMCEIIPVFQERPLGLGHAVLCAKDVVGKESFLVCLGDEIFPPWDEENRKNPPLVELIRAFRDSGKSVVGVKEVSEAETRLYGIVDLGGKNLKTMPESVLSTIEKPSFGKAPSRYAIIGRYVFRPRVFEELQRVKPTVGGEVQLTDALDVLAHSDELVALLLRGCRYDIGNHSSYVCAQVAAALHRPEIAPRVREFIRGL